MATFYSSDFLRASFLTTSVFNRGIVTMLSNLIILKHSTIPPELPKEGHRYLEYRTSCSQGIYSVPMNEIFVGQSFADCCLMIYSSKNKNKLSGCLLIGVRTFGEGHKGQLLMNPLHYNIRNGDYAIVLAASEEIANFVTEFTEKVDMKNPLNWENIFRNRSRRKTNTKASVGKHINLKQFRNSKGAALCKETRAGVSNQLFLGAFQTIQGHNAREDVGSYYNLRSSGSSGGINKAFKRKNNEAYMLLLGGRYYWLMLRTIPTLAGKRLFDITKTCTIWKGIFMISSILRERQYQRASILLYMLIHLRTRLLQIHRQLCL